MIEGEIISDFDVRHVKPGSNMLTEKLFWSLIEHGEINFLYAKAKQKSVKHKQCQVQGILKSIRIPTNLKEVTTRTEGRIHCSKMVLT